MKNNNLLKTCATESKKRDNTPFTKKDCLPVHAKNATIKRHNTPIGAKRK